MAGKVSAQSSAIPLHNRTHTCCSEFCLTPRSYIHQPPLHVQKLEAIIKQRSGAVKRRKLFIAVGEQFLRVWRGYSLGEASHSLRIAELRGRIARLSLSRPAFLAG